MQNNWAIVEKTLGLLASKGVRDVVLCPGGRNAPFVAYLENYQTQFNVYTFVDERSASFFALGISKATGRPACIITTSGTAVSEVYSAIVESYYSGQSLVVVTADRPKKFRGTGAPQTIDQAFMFKHYVSLALDVEHSGELEAFSTWNGHGSVHLNLCFNEPLIPANIPDLELKFETLNHQNIFIKEHLQRSLAYLSELEKPLVVVGALSCEQADELAPLLVKWQAMLLLESSSHLAGKAELQSLIVPSEQVARAMLKDKKFKNILRIGHIPSFKLWRELESVFSDVPVYSLSALPFAGLTRGEILTTDLKKLFVELQNNPLSFKYEIETSSFEQTKKLKDQLVERYPLSEQALVHQLSKMIDGEAQVYLGNSLPIREWNQFANIKEQTFFENRGANGIDGQVSTWFGVMKGSGVKESWMIVGDLTALYDMNALWADKFLNGTRWRLVVINNDGGKIFERMYDKKIFENSHGLNFEHFAKFWSIPYMRCEDLSFDQGLPEKVIIEIVPDNSQSRKFFEEWRGHA